MPLADWDAYRAAAADLGQGLVCRIQKGMGSVNQVYNLSGSWRKISFPPGGTVPTTAVALDYTGSLGSFSIRHPPVSSGRLCLIGSNLIVGSDGARFQGLLVDRLSHQGGLVMNVTTSQTTNLPTAALTRYTSGEGVLIGIMQYTAAGTLTTNPTTISASYTNQAGTPGRTATAIMTQAPGLDTWQIMGFQAGDTGCRSVESITLNNTLSTAANMGIVLFKPIALMPVDQSPTYTRIIGWNTEILNEAHLELLKVGNNAGDINGSLIFAEV